MTYHPQSADQRQAPDDPTGSSHFNISKTRLLYFGVRGEKVNALSVGCTHVVKTVGGGMEFQLDGRKYRIVAAQPSEAYAGEDPSTPHLPVGELIIGTQRYHVLEAPPEEPVLPDGVIRSLTKREIQIVTLVAAGLPNKQIAHTLQISEWTVSTHMRRVFAKLGVDSRAAMIYRCTQFLLSHI